ncbi:hypothetical protein B0H15DRAFT_950762 [Mycena belliarum]|uniref:Uncharacterized protein n=1 Tax=Mycena belliarum TaxID=1033014 RepID=A0AAD6XL72_9AGAR|nr:hypothetical protein B0H15DRAFT_950762 [Mycena belliae]
MDTSLGSIFGLVASMSDLVRANQGDFVSGARKDICLDDLPLIGIVRCAWAPGRPCMARPYRSPSAPPPVVFRIPSPQLKVPACARRQRHSACCR